MYYRTIKFHYKNNPNRNNEYIEIMQAAIRKMVDIVVKYSKREGSYFVKPE
jgi:hypothetical protein